MERRTLTIREAANILGVSTQTMYEISHREDFYPLLCINRKRLILSHLFYQWMDEQAGPSGA